MKLINPLSISAIKSVKLRAVYNIIIIVLLLSFIIFPTKIPPAIAGIVDSPLGIVILCLLAVVVFIYRSPFVGVLFVFSVYELIRRSNLIHKTDNMKDGKLNTPSSPLALSQESKNEVIERMNPDQTNTLEESMVEKMRSQFSETSYVETSFKPIAENTFNASPI